MADPDAQPDRSLLAQLARYGSHHGHPLNRAIHLLVDPLTVGLSFALLDLLPVRVLGLGVGTLAYLVLAMHVSRLHVLGGALTCAWIGAASWAFASLAASPGGLRVCLGVGLCFLVLQQLVGHQLVERRAPSYLVTHAGLSRLESLWESAATGSLYWPMQVLFALGLEAQLAEQLRAAEARLREG